MVRRLVAAMLAVLVASPAFAQDLRGSIQRAATEAAAQQPESQPRSGRGGLFWTGVGLLGAGGLFLGLGAAEDPDNQTCVYGGEFEDTCVSNRTVLLATGGAIAGTGAVLLAIGIAKSRNAPSVTFRPGGFVVRQSIPLPLGRK
jgi:opacity protein-like surface antigen